jgi:hypothetical protein
MAVCSFSEQSRYVSNDNLCAQIVVKTCCTTRQGIFKRVLGVIKAITGALVFILALRTMTMPLITETGCRPDAAGLPEDWH